MSIVTDRLTVGTIAIVGQIVHYVLDDRYRMPGEVRPAIVVRVFGNGVVNLQVFMDGANDNSHYYNSPVAEVNPLWVTSVDYNPDGKPGTWHFPQAVNDE